jgi:pyruvate dehydrogenase E2 component (dihydrolipoamide acetyltransferase)/2-oxoglutarate dehydrogenase E2 component (dihydrolipoamide succinyltransferase)
VGRIGAPFSGKFEMAEEVIVPKLGMAAAVVTLTEWKIEEGGRVQKGDPILDIEAEKSSFEVPSPGSGILHILLAQGEETDVNTVVALIAATEAEYASLRDGGGADAGSTEAPQEVREAPQPALALDVRDGRAPISPVARRLAAEHDLDVTKIIGTGPDGRIQKEDVEREIEARKSGGVAVSAAPGAADAGKRVKQTIPYKGMRKVIGENMKYSLATNAPNTMSGDFDLTVMAKYREALVDQEGKFGVRITYAELLIYAVAKALKQLPLMNSSLIENEIKLWEDINIGMAVALGERGEKGLVVPVIKGADQMSLVEISKAAKSLGERARADQLAPQEMTGGTFTVSNFGSVGVSAYSTPIINAPEVGILAVGRMTKKPVVKNDEIVIAPLLPYSLSHDHRVIDGAVAEAFLTILKDLVENTNADLDDLVAS